jgi:hypothetical protein
VALPNATRSSLNLESPTSFYHASYHSSSDASNSYCLRKNVHLRHEQHCVEYRVSYSQFPVLALGTISEPTRKLMKRILTICAVALSFVAGAAVSAQVRDWHDLDEVHKHVLEAIREMDHARAANHYDMEGHGARAEELLHSAEHELDLAVQSARR